MSESKSDMCIECGAKCCRHVAIELDRPTNKTDYDYIIWYLKHKNIIVYIDRENEWVIQFNTDCRDLGGDNRCLNYDNRPKICRDYPKGHQYCEYESEISPYKVLFTNEKEFIKYLEDKNIDWKFKRY